MPEVVRRGDRGFTPTQVPSEDAPRWCLPGVASGHEAIAPVVQMSHKQVSRDVAGVSYDTPAHVSDETPAPKTSVGQSTENSAAHHVGDSVVAADPPAPEQGSLRNPLSRPGVATFLRPRVGTTGSIPY
ncbi:hypothetical protein GCM10027070_23860 [Barrientosiimonas humi]